MRFILFMTLIIGIHSGVLADELHVVVNGKSIHLQSGDYNEENWGLGLQYDFTTKSDWIKFVNASWFKDSNSNTSRYVGAGLKRRYHLDNDDDGWFFDVGGIAFLMTRKDFKDNDPFPGILPFVAVGNGPITLNLTYIPSVSPKHQELLYFQLLVRVKIFE